MLAFAGVVPMHEAEHQGGGGIEPADGIAKRGMNHGRRIALASGHRRQPRGLLQRRAIGAAAAPRAGHAECRHRHHDQPRIDLQHDSGIEAETRQHVGGVIVDDGVGISDQPLQQRKPDFSGEVERDPALVAVVHLEPVGLLVGSLGVIGTARIGAAKPVRILAGLDLDDVGAEIAHLAGRGRAGPAHGEIDDAQPLQR